MAAGTRPRFLMSMPCSLAQLRTAVVSTARRRRPREASPGSAADLAGVVDVCPQRGMEFVGVLSAQVDFIVNAVQAEPDGASSLAAVDVIDVESLHFLSHENYSVRGGGDVQIIVAIKVYPLR